MLDHRYHSFSSSSIKIGYYSLNYCAVRREKRHAKELPEDALLLHVTMSVLETLENFWVNLMKLLCLHWLIKMIANYTERPCNWKTNHCDLIFFSKKRGRT